MSNAECPRCDGDNLTDYPVCQVCAKTCHFPHRAVCIHCQTAGVKDVLTPEQEKR